MYLFVLSLHNVLRWAVLIAAVYALARTLPGVGGGRAWTGREAVAARVYTSLTHLQLVVGLALYLGLSPYMRTVLDNFGAAMKQDQSRFFAVEHSTGMIVAVVFATLGSSLSRRASGDQRKYRVASLWFGLSLLVMLLLIPWWRPLLRLFGVDVPGVGG
ncbi:hypothetical protein [Deinococcus sonorensis]|uniref:Uncharacterized protein n=2 Tax=Deinococcus sonorensis TaxID=309891 RepID=A0AAU7U9T0_9DEIO